MKKVLRSIAIIMVMATIVGLLMFGYTAGYRKAVSDVNNITKFQTYSVSNTMKLSKNYSEDELSDMYRLNQKDKKKFNWKFWENWAKD